MVKTMQNQTTIQITFKNPISKTKFLPLKMAIIAYYAIKGAVSSHSYESTKLKGFRFNVRKNKIITVREQ